jgi:hypothetical protein
MPCVCLFTHSSTILSLHNYSWISPTRCTTELYAFIADRALRHSNDGLCMTDHLHHSNHGSCRTDLLHHSNHGLRRTGHLHHSNHGSCRTNHLHHSNHGLCRTDHLHRTSNQCPQNNSRNETYLWGQRVNGDDRPKPMLDFLGHKNLLGN